MQQQEQIAPKLRFPEFQDKWQESKLGKEVTKVGSGVTPRGGSKVYKQDGIPLLRSQNVRGNRLDLTDVAYIDEDVHDSMSSSKVRPNDVLLNITGASIGRSCVVPDHLIDANVNQHVCIIRLKDSTEPRFLQTLLASHKGQKLIFQSQAGGGREGLNFENIKAFKIKFPKKIEEQQKIAAFFGVVDEKIAQLHKKKDLLEEYKKGCMQKLFSQELRFTDDNGKPFPDWQKKRLEEVVSDFIVPMRDKPKDLTGNIPWCRIEDFDGRELSRSKTNQGVSSQTVKAMNLKVFPRNTLLVSCSANLGKCAIVKSPLITNQTFIGLKPLEELLDIVFFYYAILVCARELNKLSSGTTIRYLSREEFEQFQFDFPSLNEQKKIADFLSAIDDKIALVAEELDKAKTFKKGLLQQMFV